MEVYKVEIICLLCLSLIDPFLVFFMGYKMSEGGRLGERQI